MPRIRPVDPSKTNGKTQKLLAAIEEQTGTVPNGPRTLATSPAALEAFLAANRALAEGELSAQERHLVEVQVSEVNASPYCLAAHVATARASGISDEEIKDARRGSSPDAKRNALFQFVSQVVTLRGCVTDETYRRVAAAGFGDSEIGEIVGVVANTTYVNYFHLLAQTEIDYPEVKPLKP